MGRLSPPRNIFDGIDGFRQQRSRFWRPRVPAKKSPPQRKDSNSLNYISQQGGGWEQHAKRRAIGKQVKLKIGQC